jgi:hypothetical protein
VLVINLLRTTKDEGYYELLLAKRGKRAGATHLEGGRTNLLYLKHSKDSILWEQRPTPVVIAPAPKPKAKAKAKAAPKRKPTKEEIFDIRSRAKTKQIEDLDGLIARITEPMNKKQIQELAEKHGHGSPYLVKKQWSEIESRLVKSNGRRFQQPTK